MLLTAPPATAGELDGACAVPLAGVEVIVEVDALCFFRCAGDGAPRFRTGRSGSSSATGGAGVGAGAATGAAFAGVGAEAVEAGLDSAGGEDGAGSGAFAALA